MISNALLLARAVLVGTLISTLGVASTTEAQESNDPTLRKVSWLCDGRTQIVTTFLEGDPPTVRVEVDNLEWTLPLVSSGSGSKYSDGTVTLWTHANAATFESPDHKVRCAFVDPNAGSTESIEGPTWRLVSFEREGVRRDLDDGSKIRATFLDGRVTGKGVCNSYFAAYTLGPGQALEIGDVGATMMMCPKDADVESAYFASLKAASGFAITGDTLSITTTTGSMTFVRVK